LKKWKGSAVLGLTCFVLTLAIVVQMNSVDEMAREIGSPLMETRGLRDEYMRRRSMYNMALSALQRTEESLAEVRSHALANSEEHIAGESELEDNNRFLGLTDLRGNGIVITIDDNREEILVETLNVNRLLIHAEDVLYIVNELFNAGAEAVSIGDQSGSHRIVTTTPIMCDGNIIRVNNETLGVPIVIRAIGSTSRLYTSLRRPGGILRMMEEDGINVLIQREDNVRIPRFSGVHRYEYINR